MRLATYASRCIENEILMHFRAQRKLQGEVSLTDTLEAAGEGGNLSLMDVIAVDDNMLEDLDTRDACVKVRRCVQSCLTPRERMTIRRVHRERLLSNAVSAGPMCLGLRKRHWRSCKLEWRGGHRKGEQEHKLQELMSLRRRCRGRKSRGADFGLCGETVRSVKKSEKTSAKNTNISLYRHRF